VLLAKTLRSSTFKLALFCILIFGAVVIALFSYVYSATTSYVLSRSDRAIEAECALLMAAYQNGGRSGLVATINKLAADKRFGDNVYLLADSGFVPVSGNLNSWPPALKSRTGWANFELKEGKPDVADRLQLRATVETLPDGFHLLVGKNVSELKQFAARIHVALLSVITFLFVLAAFASVAVTRRTVGRIEAINATSRAIMQSGPGERVPLRGTHDEWDQLSENLNSMLDRIEALMAEVKQVTDNVAHDLRTPLTRMRGRLEKACIGERNRDSDQVLIAETMADLDDVLRMFSSLTRISQIETSNRTAAFRTVDLVEVAEAVVELFDAAAETKDVRLEVTGERKILVIGDRDLLFDAVANLADNAIKHGRGGGQVSVEVTRVEDGAMIAVSDDGPGIPAGERQFVFRRFYRLEHSRCTPGNGLGLSLVAAVARLHGGSVRLVDNAPGLKVELRFAQVENADENLQLLSDTAYPSVPA